MCNFRFLSEDCLGSSDFARHVNWTLPQYPKPFPASSNHRCLGVKIFSETYIGNTFFTEILLNTSILNKASKKQSKCQICHKVIIAEHIYCRWKSISRNEKRFEQLIWVLNACRRLKNSNSRDTNPLKAREPRFPPFSFQDDIGLRKLDQYPMVFCTLQV